MAGRAFSAHNTSEEVRFLAGHGKLLMSLKQFWVDQHSIGSDQ